VPARPLPGAFGSSQQSKWSLPAGRRLQRR
jgi:hypothetical protein